jgi:hypothetical protein
MAETLVNNNMNNGLAQNSMVMIKPKSRWQQNVYNTQQDSGLSGGIDSNLIDGGYDASNIAVTGNTVSTPVAPRAATTVRPANAVGLAAGNGLGDYGYFKDSNGEYIGMSKDAYRAAEDAGTSGLSKTAESPSMFDVAPGAQTSKFASVLAGFGAGVSGLAALGSMYYAGKNYKLQKEEADLEKDRYARAVKADKAATSNMQTFASNLGGGATYVG